ncbi:MAG: ROK family protein [Clostridia bacterium]|nr:ROK family protein [Clostridia bacterium]
MKTYGALEAGGTKMVLAALDETGRFLARKSLPTRTPEETMPEMIAFFREQDVSALGIGSFGPLQLNPAAPDYGAITATPKLAWRNYPLLRRFEEALGVPVGIDTDVNAAAMAEAALGAARGLDNCLYVTVGTGVGGGLVIAGKPVHGLIHPEIGHIPVRPEPGDPMPEGVCPSHGSCLEGMASGPSIGRRWGCPAQELPPDHPAWALEAAYLAQLCATALLAFSPEKIILGGGVMQQTALFPLIRAKTAALLNGYLVHPAIQSGMEDLIVPPALSPDSGILGSWLIAKESA